MVEFRKSGYYQPMDREYYTSQDIKPSVEEPIYPVSALGETVPASLPGGRNIIQTTQAAIRGGASTLQIVGTQQGQVTKPGAFTAAYGKEVKQALRETALAAGANIVGVEMPTSMSNFSGLTQRGFSESARRETLAQVKEAIKFVGEISRGGGVDMVSFEFERPLSKVETLHPEDRGLFDTGTEEKIFALVNQKTGELQHYRKTKAQAIPYVKDPDSKYRFQEIKKLPEVEQKKYIDPQTGLPKLNTFEWNDFQKWAEYETRKKGELVTPEEVYMRVVLDNQKDVTRGLLSQAERQERAAREQYEEYQKALKDPNVPEELKERAKSHLPFLKRQIEEFRDSAIGQLQQIEEIETLKRNLKPVEGYAPKKTEQSYAEAGIAALRETQALKAKGQPHKDLYVGPEIGWPDYYGGHPDEFIDIIQNARNKMAEMLTKRKIVDETGNMVDNPYYDPNISPRDAHKLADRHIQGTMDTSHLGMWYKHFKPKKGETDEQRLKRFNKWYLDQVEKIASANVVGGIQLVDSGSGEHGHLPPGEGIFPVIETAKVFKDHGFKGFLVSEGHEEETFGQGRIRTKLWEKAGATGTGYFNRPAQWRDISSSYFGKSYSPKFMFGSYVPSNDFRLWSEVPLE